MVAEVVGPSSFGLIANSVSPRFLPFASWGDTTGIAEKVDEKTIKTESVTANGRTFESRSYAASKAGWQYKVMEFVQGKDMADYLVEHPDVMLDAGTPEHKIVDFLMDIRDKSTKESSKGPLRLVLSHRTPTGYKNQRGHWQGDTLFINTKKKG